MKLKYVLRRRLQETEVETETDEPGFELAYTKLEELYRKASAMEEKLEPARKLYELVKETKIYWVTDEKSKRIRDEITQASYRVALSVLDSGNKGKGLSTIAEDTGLPTQLVFYYLKQSRNAPIYYSQDSNKSWSLTPKGVSWIRDQVLPSLQGQHGNPLSKILQWIDQRVFKSVLEKWTLGELAGKAGAQDNLEYSVGLLLASIGFSVFQVGMFNDHFDMIAYSSDLGVAFLCDCTVGSVRKKASSLGGVVDDFVKALPDISALGVVVTTERVKSTDRKDMSNDRISIVDRDQIRQLMKLATVAGNPESLVDVIQRGLA